MTHVYDDPSSFRQDAIDGFALAYERYVRRVPGASGLVRADGPREGKVSLVVGGGSGHYPSYAGIVGVGFADGCVLGDIFTSPSAHQCYRIARAADGGAGVVFAFGNYAGDRLNFAAAQQRLDANGIDVRIVYVTDDIASAPRDERGQRRGIAGTAVVYKIGGAAADLGFDLDGVERVMRAANDATVSFGVAFRGCTMPGADEPLFTVADGRMDFGLGIHGEPGVQEAGWMPAQDLADQLVDAVLAERPDGARRAALVVNGLGATKYEELFVLYRHVSARMADAGIEAVLPEVGELVTSLDMAGCSLSLTWLDDELARLWAAPADTAAFRRIGSADFPQFARMPARDAAAEEESADVEQSSEASAAAADTIRHALSAALEVLKEQEKELGRIDAVAGDGDHGQGMVRGMTAAVEAAGNARGGAGAILHAAGDAFSDRAGGTSGILWGILLDSVGATLGNQDDVGAQQLADALEHGADMLQRVGGAKRGDKTMLDSLLPFVDSYAESARGGEDLATAWNRAAHVATEAAQQTAELRPKVGRARPLAERSVGTPDAGAVSIAMIVTAIDGVLADTTSTSAKED